MSPADFVKDLPCRGGTSVGYVVQSLTDTLFRIGARGNIQKTLISLRVLHNGRSLSFDPKHHGALALLELLHEIAGPPAEAVSD
jgi:hypothetical protein